MYNFVFWILFIYPRDEKKNALEKNDNSNDNVNYIIFWCGNIE